MGFIAGSVSSMVGASTTVTGSAGQVPAPALGKNTRYLSSNATFGEVPLLPQYKNTATGNWISNYMVGGAGGSGAINARLRAFYIMYIPSDGNIDTLGFRVVAAPTVTAFNLHVALWEVNEDGTVGSYVIGGNGSSGLTNGVTISISISSTAVKKGYYWISATSDINTSPGSIGMITSSGATIYYSFMGSSTLPTSTNVFVPNYTATTYNQTTHETFNYSNPAGFGNQLPSLAIQYV